MFKADEPFRNEVIGEVASIGLKNLGLKLLWLLATHLECGDIGFGTQELRQTLLANQQG